LKRKSTRRSDDPVDPVRPWYGAVEFRTLAETNPCLIFVGDGRGRNVYTNTAFQRFTGKSADQLLGVGYFAVIHPDDIAPAEALHRSIHENSVPFEVEQKLRRHDGEYRTHLVRGAPVKDADGRVLRWIGSCTDIHELRAAVTAADQATEILAAIGRSTEAAVFAKDANGDFVFANNATLEVMGKASEELIGADVMAHAASAGDAAKIDDNDAQVLREDRTLAFDESWTGEDGVTRTYRSTKGPWRSPDGERGIVGIAINVTRERELERSIAASNARFRAIFDSVPILLWVTDAKGEIVVRNNLWSDFTGLPDSCENPISFADIIDPLQFSAFEALWQLSISDGEMLEMDVALLDRISGTYVPHTVRMIPIYAHGGSVTAWVGSAITL
jgi:PAS domain S-box-containing protein